MRRSLLLALPLLLVACPAPDDKAETGVDSADELDSGCDGADGEPVWYADGDADGFGAPGEAISACEQPDGYVPDATDCDDTSALVHPGADEADCTDPVDYNCDGTVAYADADADRFVACLDCDDRAPDVNPGATETCNGMDDDCDGAVDEADAGVTWYADTDGDGYGTPDTTTTACDAPSGYVGDATDCDDSSAGVAPGLDERCNGIDDNCDGAVDDASSVDQRTWYIDADGDGAGLATTPLAACDQPAGYVANDYDCDDASLEPCACELTEVAAPTTLYFGGSYYGNWVVDPLEALGADLIWEMDYLSGTSIVEYANEAMMIARTATRVTDLPYDFDGTGAAVYDGYLYYNAADSRDLVKYDIATGATTVLELADAGYRNTYNYEWGGYTDIDFAVDEQGLWVIYATAGNSGRIVVSKIDEATFTLTDTWETSSPAKRSLGNAWMVCGVLYTTDDHASATTTVNFAFDTADERSWDPAIPFSNPHLFNTSINYNPADGKLRAWDSMYRQTYTTTVR
ncbi:MAG: MopE-related protein [Myxococcota bacterium]